jgi:hypothetical protein
MSLSRQTIPRQAAPAKKLANAVAKKVAKIEARSPRPQPQQQRRPMRPLAKREVQRALVAKPGMVGRSFRTERTTTREGMLAMMNPYYASIANPLAKLPSRIPDGMTTPSSTFAVTLKGELTAGPTGCCAIAFGVSCYDVATAAGRPALAFQSMLVPGCIFSFPDTSNTAIPGFASYVMGFFTDGLDFAAGDPVWQLGATPIKGDGWSSAADSVPKTFSRARLVSAILKVQGTGAVNTTQGAMTGVSCPRMEIFPVSGDSSISLTALRNKPGAQTISLNTNKAMEVKYAPVDPLCWQYADLPTTDGIGEPGVQCVADTRTVVTTGPLANTGFVWPEGGYTGLEMAGVHAPGQLWIGCTGCSDAQPFEWEYTANFEAIPRQTESMLVSAYPSKSDPLAAATAMNAVATMPKVTAGDAVPLNTRSGVDHSNNGPSPPGMLDRLTDGLMSGAKGLGEVAKFAAPIALAAL